MTNNMTIDIDAAAKVFGDWITGEGLHWDRTMVAMHPEMEIGPDEEDWYIIDHCAETGRCADDLEPGSAEWKRVLREWTAARSATCAAKLSSIPIIDGRLHLHRIIACEPSELRPELGIFWSHDISSWDDPITPWGPTDKPILMIEAMVPAEAADWQLSCMALMSWLRGDMESELRVAPGHPVEILSITALADGARLPIPDEKWTT